MSLSDITQQVLQLVFVGPGLPDDWIGLVAGVPQGGYGSIASIALKLTTPLLSSVDSKNQKNS